MGAKVSWAKKACDECGNEEQFSRSEPRDIDEPFTCSVCKMVDKSFDRGYEAGYKDARAKYEKTEAPEFTEKRPVCPAGYRGSHKWGPVSKIRNRHVNGCTLCGAVRTTTFNTVDRNTVIREVLYKEGT